MRTARYALLGAMVFTLAVAAGAEVLSKEYEEHLAQGRQLLGQQRYEEAIEALVTAESLAPGQSLAALTGLTRAYRKTDRLADAIEAHRGFLKSATDPDLAALASNMLGVLLLQADAGDAGPRESEQAFRRALELRPVKAFRARLNLAEVLHRGGDEDLATGVLEEFPPSEPADGFRFMSTSPVSEEIYDRLTEVLLARDPEAPVYLQGSVAPPERISAPTPVYNKAALENRTQGKVVVRNHIDSKGNVVNTEVLRGVPDGLTEAAVDAYRQWRFKPATFRGRPVAVLYNSTTNFRLPEKDD